MNLTCDRLEASEAEGLQRVLTKYGYQTPVQDIGGGERKSKLLRDFWGHNGANSERDCHERFDAMTGPKLCSEIVADGPAVDALFLDCGELSNVVEFALLEPILPAGGYLLLHDIRYPKSIKNFLVATYLELSSDWEVIYTDLVTPQGGMVAVRRESTSN